MTVFMIADAPIKRQTEILREAAEPLYRLAFYTLGDRRLAERTAAAACIDAFGSLSDACDVGVFLRRCFSLLYKYVKRTCPESGGAGSADAGKQPLERMLSPLSFDEKYIMLLFCREKLTMRQISEITGLAECSVEKLLSSAAVKTNGAAGKTG